MIVGIAAMMFVALFGWGQDYFHWTDPSGKVQLALLFFYAALLLLVPLLRALFAGELPIELSLKGARWSESVEVLGDDFSRRLSARRNSEN